MLDDWQQLARNQSQVGQLRVAALPGRRSPVAMQPSNNHSGAGERNRARERTNIHTHRSPVGAPSDLTQTVNNRQCLNTNHKHYCMSRQISTNNEVKEKIKINHYIYFYNIVASSVTVETKVSLGAPVYLRPAQNTAAISLLSAATTT